MSRERSGDDKSIEMLVSSLDGWADLRLFKLFLLSDVSDGNPWWIWTGRYLNNCQIRLDLVMVASPRVPEVWQ